MRPRLFTAEELKVRQRKSKKLYQDRNKDKIRKRRAEYRKKNYQKLRRIERVQQKKNRENTQLKLAGRSKPVFCEGCGNKSKIYFDHDHKTGKFRAWVCLSCNIILGHAKDCAYTLEKLAKLLRKNEKNYNRR